MKSRTKHLLSQEKQREIIHNYCRQAVLESAKELTGGMFNSAYELRLSNAPVERAILKVGTDPSVRVLTYETDIMRRELAAYDLLGNRTDLPLAEILCRDTSRTILKSDYFVMTKLEGELWNKTRIPPEHKPGLLDELGQCLAKIHRIPGPYFGYFSNDSKTQFSSWREAFFHMVEDILMDGQRGGIRLPFEQVRKILLRHSAALDEVKEPRLVNYDLWAGNLFLSKKDGVPHISGLIDLERCFWGDPFADFTSCVSVFSDVEKEPALRNGYSKVTQSELLITPGDRIRMQLYRLYMALIMTVETYRYSKPVAWGARQIHQRKIKKQLTILWQTPPVG